MLKTVTTALRAPPTYLRKGCCNRAEDFWHPPTRGTHAESASLPSLIRGFVLALRCQDTGVQLPASASEQGREQVRIQCSNLGYEPELRSQC